MPGSSKPSSRPASRARPRRAEAGRADTAAGERIAKYLARAGLCSRREAERWIAAGRVSVDGAVLATPATLVGEGNAVEVDGKPVGPADRRRLWRYHKPRGLICTNADPEGRQTVFDALPDDLPRVVSVGRLDINSEGLLLLTNDGGLAGTLERGDWTRRYRVRAFGIVDEDRLSALANGTVVDGIAYGPISARLDSREGRNAWLTVSLTEGRNREIKRVFESLGLAVNRLIRTGYGPFLLGGLARGAVAEVKEKVLKEQLGRADRRR